VGFAEFDHPVQVHLNNSDEKSIHAGRYNRTYSTIKQTYIQTVFPLITRGVILHARVPVSSFTWTYVYIAACQFAMRCLIRRGSRIKSTALISYTYVGQEKLKTSSSKLFRGNPGFKSIKFAFIRPLWALCIQRGLRGHPCCSALLLSGRRGIPLARHTERIITS
jgi:hypothetical protein